MKNRIAAFTIAFAAVMFTSGCVVSLGGGSKAVQPPSPTVGQELIDLQAAKERGAISEDEYEAQKQEMLRAR